jgi:hypothetical protein
MAENRDEARASRDCFRFIRGDSSTPLRFAQNDRYSQRASPASSDLIFKTVRSLAHDLEELAQRADEMSPLGLTLSELAGLSYYAVEARYDLDAWPEQETANEEIEVAERVKAAVLEQIPEQAHP